MAQRNGASPSRRPLPPFPKRQMFILALCRICEPIAFMSIFPYIYYMVKDFNITNDESKISFYAGMVTSAFTFAEFSTGVMWGRLSDKIGRKPVLLMGLAGTGLSVLLFGFSPNLPMALFARALGGLLNGNIGVLQTTVAELVTVKEHQPRAYTIMPLVWCLGSIIGPMIGGALAKPVDNFPAIFAPGSLWEKFPYLLPNLFSALCVFMGLTVGVLFLEETHAEKKTKRDPGLEIGKYVLSLVGWGEEQPSRPSTPMSTTKNPEMRPLLEREEPLPGYLTNSEVDVDSSDNDQLTRGSVELEASAGVVQEAAKPKVKVFTRTVVLNIVSYGILAFHTMTFDSLLPVFLSSEVRDKDPMSLPFKFSGGFGFDTKVIGVILSVQGIYSLFSTVCLFPLVTRRLGALNLFRLLAASYFLLYLTTPYLVLLPENLRMVGIYIIVVWKCTFSTMAYPSNAILLTNSAPSTLSLGTINGVAASTASLCRAFGPTISGLLFSLGGQTGYSGLSWWVSGLVTIAGAFISFKIIETPGRFDEKVEDVETAAVPVEPLEPFDQDENTRH